MLGYALRRLASAIPTLLIVAASVFVLMRIVPGDPALLALGDNAEPEQLRQMRAAMGLDQPLPAQFADWMGKVLVGDFGKSAVNGEAVLPLIVDRFQTTALIVLLAVAFAVLAAVPLGLVAAWKQDSAADLATVGLATLLLSIPSFWLGLILLLVFGVWLKWLPVVGYVAFSENAWAALTFIILPVVTLTLIEIGVLTRMARSAAIDVLRLEYIAHARAKA